MFSVKSFKTSPVGAPEPRCAMAPLQLQLPHKTGHQPRVWFEVEGGYLLNPRTLEPVHSVVVSKMGSLFADW